ncbi:MAG: YggT family protein [Armatimonadetes bacterium]|nr:YggT family protein [Armatimonadota bacterium]
MMLNWRLQQPTDLLIWMINLLVLCILFEVILSWLRLFNVRVPLYNPIIRSILRVSGAILSPVRDVLWRFTGRMGFGGMSIDFSPIIALVGLMFLSNLIVRIFG